MAKRKGAVKDIIYELDNDDIELSSDEEVRAKISRIDTDNSPIVAQNDSISQESVTEVIDIDDSLEIINCDVSSTSVENGGKKDSDIVISDPDDVANNKTSESTIEISNKKKGADNNKTTLFHEDIDIDSPGNSDLGVVGCENRTPLITVRFNDNKLASSYKEKIKAFMLSLIKLHEKGDSGSDSETDLELDIWPEDLSENVTEPDKEDNSYFFVDTAPCEQQEFVPTYNSLKDDSLISNTPDLPTPSTSFSRRGPTCFNCDGDHSLRDCKMPKNFTRINEMRAIRMTKRTERYHMEDEQRFGHMIPGRISGRLRDALGLKRSELPLHIYRMRLLGYPPAWLEEARISHSGISLFDSSGRATLEPDEEEGEWSEPGSKDKFDIKKIWDFPGFNIPASNRYRDGADYLPLPPMSETDSKLAMLQALAPNAMKAYKRKKLTFFPSAGGDTSQGGQAEMEIDSGDDSVDFPSAPPLPDEAPLPPPPPPASPPPLPPGSPPKSPPEPDTISQGTDDSIGGIPIPIADMIVLDEEGESEPNSGRTSPTLDDLEVKKKLLMDALLNDPDSVSNDEPKPTEPSEKPEIILSNNDNEVASTNDIISEDSNTQTPNPDDGKEPENTETDSQMTSTSSLNTQTEDNTTETNASSLNTQTEDNTTEVIKTPESKLKTIRTDYGTPIIDSVTPYNNLPSDDKFAKDICDIINFENLPNSIGKYKKISTLLKKVKHEVDRIQDS